MGKSDLDTILARIKELDRLHAKAKELGYTPKNGILFTPEELDDLFENRNLITIVK